MKRFSRLLAIVAVAGTAVVYTGTASAFFGFDDWFDPWDDGPYYGYPGYGYGGYPGYGYGRYPGYGYGGYGGYPGYGYGGYPGYGYGGYPGYGYGGYTGYGYAQPYAVPAAPVTPAAAPAAE
jgi:hypothetical protein